jgi:hypothetical protein
MTPVRSIRAPALASIMIRTVKPLPPPPFELPVVGVAVAEGDAVADGDGDAVADGDGDAVAEGDGVGVGVGALTVSVPSWCRVVSLLAKTSTAYGLPGAFAGIFKVTEKCPLAFEVAVPDTRTSLCPLGAI